MDSYLLFMVDEHGAFVGVVEFLAIDDRAAVEIAERRRHGRPVEIWKGPNLVAKLTAKPGA
jgi:hypothetical protein